MSESKHTPGNWFVSDQPDAELHRIAIHADVVRGDRRYELRGLAYATWQDCDQRDEYEANARLIAACPDLLAVVQRVVAIADATNETGDLAQQARAALAKATGGQQ